MREKLTIGQQVWWAEREPRRQHLNGYVTVTKVGRKWIGLSNGERVDVKNGRADGQGFASNGRAWPTEADWISERERQEAWRALCKAIDGQWYAPDGLATAEITQMIDRLRALNEARDAE